MLYFKELADIALNVPKRFSRIIRAIFSNPLMMKNLFPSKFFKPFAPMHKEIMKKFLFGKKLITLALIPRGFGKNSLVLYLLILVAGIFFRVKYIVVVEEIDDKAKQSNFNFRNNLKNSKEFVDIFGNVEGDRWSHPTVIVKSETYGFEFCVDFVSMDKASRGLQWDGHRPGIILINDIEDSKSRIPNAKLIESKISKIENIYIPALQEQDEYGRGGLIWWLGTTVSWDCVCLRVSRWDETDVIRFPALDENEKSTWEEMFTTKSLLAKRDRFYRKDNAIGWLSEFMLDPNPEISINQKNIKTFKLIDIDKNNPFILRVAVDSSYSVKKSSDPTGISVGGYGVDGNFYIFYSYEGKYLPEVFYKKLASIVSDFRSIGFPINYIGVESTAFEFVRFGLRTCEQKDVFKSVSVQPISHPSDSKIDRVMQNLLKIGSTSTIFIEERCTELINQVNNFPSKMKSWGCIDSAASLAKIAIKSRVVELAGDKVDPASLEAIINKRLNSLNNKIFRGKRRFNYSGDTHLMRNNRRFMIV